MMTGHIQAETVSPGRPYAAVLTAAWVFLLLLGALFLFAAISDLRADVRAGLPADHLAAFAQATGGAWASAKQTAPGLTAYVTLLEYAYAIHELVFGLLFVIIIAIPFASAGAGPGGRAGPSCWRTWPTL
jgi:hypothetical protein